MKAKNHTNLLSIDALGLLGDIVKNDTDCVVTQLITKTVVLFHLDPLGNLHHWNGSRIFGLILRWNQVAGNFVNYFSGIRKKSYPMRIWTFLLGFEENSLKSCCCKSRSSCLGDWPDGTARNCVSAVAGELTGSALTPAITWMRNVANNCNGKHGWLNIPWILLN